MSASYLGKLTLDQHIGVRIPGGQPSTFGDLPRLFRRLLGDGAQFCARSRRIFETVLFESPDCIAFFEHVAGHRPDGFFRDVRILRKQSHERMSEIVPAIFKPDIL